MEIERGHAARLRARRAPLRDLGRDRSPAQRPHRAHDRGRPPPPRRRRRPVQRVGLGDGPGPDGGDGRRVRDPARPRPRVPRPRHDPRPEPDGARVRAARGARAGRAQHPRAHRRPAADRRLPDRDAASGTSTRSASSRSWPGSTAARTRRARRSASRPRSRSRAPSTRPPPTPRPSGTAWSASWPPAPTLIMTQPLYDAAQVETMLTESRRRFGPGGFPVPLLLGVLPLVSARHAEFLHNEVPGITIPDATRARMRDAGAAGTEAGIDMADALLSAVGDEVAGHVPHAQLRALRAGGRARPADPRAAPDGGGRRVVSEPPLGSPRRGRSRSRSWARCGLVGRRARRRAPVPAPGRGPGGLRHRRGLPARHGRAGRGRPSTRIEQRTGAEVAVYTQLVPCCESTAQAEQNARALMDQWGVGRRGFDDGLVILFDLHEGDACHGEVQLYAGPGYAAKFLSNGERQAIFEEDMLPLLRRCDLDGALLVAMDQVDAAATPEHAAQLNFFRLLNAVLGLLGGSGGVRADRRLRAARLVPPRTRPRVPRRSVDPHPRTARRPDPGGRGRRPRRQVQSPRPDDGQPRPRVARPDRVPDRGDRPPRPHHASCRSRPSEAVDRRPGRDVAPRSAPGSGRSTTAREFLAHAAPEPRRRDEPDRQQGAAVAGQGRRRVRQADRGARRRAGLVHARRPRRRPAAGSGGACSRSSRAGSRCSSASSCHPTASWWSAGR